MLGLKNKEGKAIHGETYFWKLPKEVLLYIIQIAANDELISLSNNQKQQQTHNKPTPPSITTPQ